VPAVAPDPRNERSFASLPAGSRRPATVGGPNAGSFSNELALPRSSNERSFRGPAAVVTTLPGTTADSSAPNAWPAEPDPRDGDPRGPTSETVPTTAPTIANATAP